MKLVGFTEDQRKQIEDEIVRTMIQALENRSITEDQSSVIATLVLDKMSEVHDEESLQVFLKDLASRFVIFKPLVVLRLRDLQEKIEDEVAEGVLLLVKHGKIDDAIKLAQNANMKKV